MHSKDYIAMYIDRYVRTLLVLLVYRIMNGECEAHY